MLSFVIKLFLVDHSIPYLFALIESEKISFHSSNSNFHDSNSAAGLLYPFLPIAYSSIAHNICIDIRGTIFTCSL